ncbi:MAG: hypothetical protein OCC46_00230 [Pseudodesulfovibrio sp.]
MKPFLWSLVLVCLVFAAPNALAAQYGDSVARGNEKACKDHCDTAYPDERGLCHEACYEKYPQGQGRGQRPPKDGGAPKPPPGKSGQRGGPQAFDMAQTLSLGAQTNTIAFDGVAFITGSLCADSFIPPGKVCDYFGFQYLRDNDITQKGHNTDFLTTVSHNVLFTLSRIQRAQIIALAKEQAPQTREYALMRFPLLKAFRRNIEGDFPTGTSRLSMASVQEQSAKLYRLDGEMSVRRAQVIGGIIRSLTPDQRAYFDALKGKGIDDWPNKRSPIDKRNYTHDVDVGIMTIASQLYSWYAGSVEADTYFCPERHGTYFGSFYMKDIPAMGKKNYTINENLTGERGKDFLMALDSVQAKKVRDLVDRQSPVMSKIVSVREEISRMLRMYLVTDTVDDAVILRLSEQYGRYDGVLIYLYATTFADVAKTLTKGQQAELEALRGLKGYTCTGMYIYSDRIGMPRIENTDGFFE